MSAVLSERELTPFEAQMQKRRIVKAIATDLVASSVRCETPAGLVTLVDIKFLRELADVAQVTGEHLYAVVDETHLARIAQAAGLIDRVPPPSTVPGEPLAVAPEDIRAVIKWKGWTGRDAAMEFGVSEATIYNWKAGMHVVKGHNRRRLFDLIQEMRAAQAAAGGDA